MYFQGVTWHFFFSHSLSSTDFLFFQSTIFSTIQYSTVAVVVHFIFLFCVVDGDGEEWRMEIWERWWDGMVVRYCYLAEKHIHFFSSSICSPIDFLLFGFWARMRIQYSYWFVVCIEGIEGNRNGTVQTSTQDRATTRRLLVESLVVYLFGSMGEGFTPEHTSIFRFFHSFDSLHSIKTQYLFPFHSISNFFLKSPKIAGHEIAKITVAWHQMEKPSERNELSKSNEICCFPFHLGAMSHVSMSLLLLLLLSLCHLFHHRHMYVVPWRRLNVSALCSSTLDIIRHYAVSHFYDWIDKRSTPMHSKSRCVHFIDEGNLSLNVSWGHSLISYWNRMICYSIHVMISEEVIKWLRKEITDKKF